MTGPGDMIPDPHGPELTGDELLAAEYAMGLLEGEDLLAARGRLSREPQLAGMVAWWEQRLAPLLDDVGGAQPSPEVWGAIAAELEEADAAPSPVVLLQRRVTLWQRIAAGSAVAAMAALALFVVQPGSTPEPASPAEAPLVASIPITDTPLWIGVTFLPDREEMLVAADGLTADGVHDHELWLMPRGEGAAPLSLGVVRPGTQKRVAIDATLAQAMEQGAQVLLSQEPIGGAPDKTSPGPVVAQGTLQTT